MKRLIAWVVSSAALAGCVTVGMTGQGAVIRAKEKVEPALVHIRPVKEVFTRGRREEVVVVGSGFLISRDGYVVTNEHVAGGSKVVRCVLFDKTEVGATVVGTDRYTDVAVLKLDTDRKDLPTAKLGDSSTLKAGQTVLALGSPHGLARSVSMGIISVTDRYLGDSEMMPAPFNTWIQTDAAINPGNSGGPLVNLKGEVIGVNARRLGAAENVGFAIPINIAKEVVSELIRHGRVQRSWTGLTLQEMTSKTEDPATEGVVIADVDPLSPAAEAGLRPGDFLLAVNGIPTHARFAEELPAVNKLLADLPVGTEVAARVSRGGEMREIRLRPEEKSDTHGSQIECAEWGLTAAELTPAIVRRAQLPSKNGVLISGTQTGGLAHSAGLHAGDIVLRIDEEEVTDLPTFRKLYEERVASNRRLVLLDVKRGALSRYVLIKRETEEKVNAD